MLVFEESTHSINLSQSRLPPKVIAVENMGKPFEQEKMHSWGKNKKQTNSLSYLALWYGYQLSKTSIVFWGMGWVAGEMNCYGWIMVGNLSMGLPVSASYYRVRVMTVFNSSAPAGHWTETLWNNKCSYRVDGILKLCLFSFCYLIYLKVDKTFICNWVLPPFSHVNVESCLLYLLITVHNWCVI